MFENPGKTIKTVASIIFSIGIIALFVGVLILFNSDSTGWVGFVALGVGFLVCWCVSVFLDGLGTMIENSEIQVEAQKALYAAQQKTNELLLAAYYTAATKLMNEEKYEEALISFTEIANHRDCAAHIHECKMHIIENKYTTAVALKNAGKYEEAITTFNAIKNHKDSTAQITACETAILDNKYDSALALINAGKYEDAITVFSAIKNHKDSAAQITACETIILDNKYDAALSLMNAGKYEDAIAAFSAIKNHKDSAAQITACETIILDNKYDAALSLMNAGKYEDAIAAFSAIKNHKDSAAKASTIYTKEKEEKLAKAMVGDYITFGAYEQDNNTSNGTEAIEWQVLTKENNRLLLISRYALDNQPYNQSRTKVIWETCTLRKWLNHDFLNVAFSSAEQTMITNVPLTACKNHKYIIDPSNNTQDKIFLLSIAEVEQYFSSDSAIQCKPTAYAKKQGAGTASDGFCFWWLRSPGDRQNYATYVCNDGGISESGYYVNSSDCAVRPALWIDLNP